MPRHTDSSMDANKVFVYATLSRAVTGFKERFSPVFPYILSHTSVVHKSLVGGRSSVADAVMALTQEVVRHSVGSVNESTNQDPSALLRPTYCEGLLKTFDVAVSFRHVVMTSSLTFALIIGFPAWNCTNSGQNCS